MIRSTETNVGKHEECICKRYMLLVNISAINCFSNSSPQKAIRGDFKLFKISILLFQ